MLWSDEESVVLILEESDGVAGTEVCDLSLAAVVDRAM